MSSGSRSPTFSLVFLTWNAEDCIHETLDSVANQARDDFEVVIVDNASDDGTVAAVREFMDVFPIILLENDRNLGFAAGTNRGIRASNGDYICCYNHDTQFPPDYLDSVSSHVSSDTVFTTARLNHRTSTDHECVRLLGRWRFPMPYIVDDLTGTMPVNYVPGDGVIIPREIVKRRGEVFDPRLPSRGEDVDFSLWLQSQSIPIKAILDTYSIHPDNGPYSLTLENAIAHMENVWARFQAYQRNGMSLLDAVAILASCLFVPVKILHGSFPSSEEKLIQQQCAGD